MEALPLREALQSAFPPDVLAELLQKLGSTVDCPEQVLLDGLFPQYVQDELVAQAVYNTAGEGSACSSFEGLSSLAAAPVTKKALLSSKSLPASSLSQALLRNRQERSLEEPPSEGFAEDPLRQGWLLCYPKGVESSFTFWYSASQKVTDDFGSAAYFLLASSSFLIWAKYLCASLGFWTVFCTFAPSIFVTGVLAAVIPVLQLFCPAVYSKHRDGVIATVRAVNVIYNLLHRRMFPVVHSGSMWVMAMLISTGSVPLAMPAVRHRVRFCVHLKIHTFLALLCAVSVVGGGSSNPLLMNQGLLTVLVAYVLPTCVVYACEVQARKSFARSYAARLAGLPEKGAMYAGRANFVNKSL